VRYNGEELDGGGTIDDWTRVDLNAAYEFSDNVEIYGRIENVLDTEYQQVLGYGTPGRSGSIGVRLRY
jgi:vitamin B12 transporter